MRVTLLLLAFGLSLLGQAVPPKPEAVQEFQKAEALRRKSDMAGARAAYEKAIAIDPDYAEAHSNLIFTYRVEAFNGAVTPEQSEAAKAKLKATYADLKVQYQKKADADPKRAIWQWALGNLAQNLEKPEEAEAYYRKAVALNPKFAKAWQELSLMAEFSGDEKESLEAMRRAAEAEPWEPSYSFYYASNLREFDRKLWVEKSLEVAKRFPDHERGAQALYWLGYRAANEQERVKYLEQLKASYAPQKYSWSSSGMTGLAVSYFRQDPKKALAFATEMAGVMTEKSAKDSWAQHETFFKAIVDAGALLDQGKKTAAIAILDQAKPPRFFEADAAALAKAALFVKADQVSKAYDELLKLTAKTPSDELIAALNQAGAKLSKAPNDVDADLWRLRLEGAKPAAELDLENYYDGKRVKLADYRGKPVLVTFWYPGCGPCRAEFPYFQNVLDKYGDKLVILAPSVHPYEDRYVIPFMKNMKYGFIPLKCDEKWASKNYNARGYPTNALVDHEGTVVFAPRSHDEKTQRVFELQVEAILRRAAQEAK